MADSGEATDALGEMTESIGDVVEDAGEVAEQVADSAPVEYGARAGLLGFGVVHLLIGWIAVRLAWAGRPVAGEDADVPGAMATLAAQPFGKVLLWSVAVSLAALALWQAGAVVWQYQHPDLGRRRREKAVAAGRALLYLGLGASAVSSALGSRSSSSQSTARATAGLLALPHGRVLVLFAASVIVVSGVGIAAKGVRKAFRDEIDTAAMPERMRAIAVLVGQIGYATKGLALVMVGGLIGYAAWTFQESRAQGLDAAMQLILAQPLGRYLLTTVAVGFAAFGLFAGLQARYRRM